MGMQWQFGIQFPPSPLHQERPPTPRLLADIGHFAVGALFVALPVALWPRNKDAPYWGYFGAFAFATLKDPIFDTIYEGDTYEASLLDTAEYLLGAAATAAAIYFIRNPRLNRAGL